MTTLPQIGLIADDFTGAMDSGAQFSHSPLGVHFRFAGQSTGDVEIVNTASREINEAQAVARARNVCQLLTGRQLFKKIDSTLRGHVAAEIEAILSASPYRKAVICSAAPLQGRTIRDGVLYIDGVPLEQTAFKDDPVYPATSSLVSELIGKRTSRLSLREVRGSVEELAHAICGSGYPLITVDAETPEDLLAIARAILMANALPCGAFGLAKAYLEALELPSVPQAVFHTEGRVLILVGSANQIGRDQARRLETRPDSLVVKLDCVPDVATLKQSLSLLPSNTRILVLCADQGQVVRSPEWLRFGRTVSDVAVGLLDLFQPETILVIGGETVTYFCDLLETESIQILGEATPGIPFGRIHGGRLDGCLLVTKAGGFGHASTLTDILSFAEEQ
jgi:uncharacterized protein YgbK (DUF1537 family)